MSQGLMFVLDQLGQTVMLKDQRIAQLAAEVEQLRTRVAELQPEPSREQE